MKKESGAGDLYTGMKVMILGKDGDKIEGVINGSFGKSGKLKVRVEGEI